MVHVGHSAYCMLGFGPALGRVCYCVFSLLLSPKLLSPYPTPYSLSYRQTAGQALIPLHFHKIGPGLHHHWDVSTAKGRFVIYQNRLDSQKVSLHQIIEAFGDLRVAL